MAYQPTRAEGQALHAIALALRPEWTPRKEEDLGPGGIWQRDTKGEFPHAENFDHCLSALIDYCRAESKGKPRYTHATLFPGEGEHWTTTVPQSIEKNPRDPCEDHPHDKNNAWNCIGCRSEILAGDRPASKQGVAMTPKGPAVPAPTKEPQ